MLLKPSFHWTESLTLSLTSIQRMSVTCLWGCWPANRTKVSRSARCSGSLDVSFIINHLHVFHRIWQRRRARWAEWVEADFSSRLFGSVLWGAITYTHWPRVKEGTAGPWFQFMLCCLVLIQRQTSFSEVHSRGLGLDVNLRRAALWTVFLWQKQIMLLAPFLWLSLKFTVDWFLDLAMILFVFLCVCLQSRQADSYVLPQ